MLHIRTATLHDLPLISSIQAACYAAEFIEDDIAFASKLQQAAPTCWLACVDQHVVAYLICLPVSPANFPQLNATEFCLTPDANMLYLHDLAVHPDHRIGRNDRARADRVQLALLHRVLSPAEPPVLPILSSDKELT